MLLTLLTWLMSRLEYIGARRRPPTHKESAVGLAIAGAYALWSARWLLF